MKKKYDEKISMFPILTSILFLRILSPSTCYVNYNHNYLRISVPSTGLISTTNYREGR